MNEPHDRPGADRNLVLATIAFGVCFAAWGMLAPLAPDLQDDLGLSDTETSVMIAVPVILGSLLRVPIGWATDRWGGRLLFGMMLIYSAGAAVLIGFAESYEALLGAGFLLGTTGASFAVGVPFVAEWFEESRQGFAVGVYGVGNVGTAVAAFSVPAIVGFGSQQLAGIIFGVVIGAFALVWFAKARNAPVSRHQRPDYLAVLKSGWALYRLSIFYFVTFGGFVAMAIFLPKLLTDWFDFSLQDAGLRAAGFTLAATAARPLGGWLSDRVGGRLILIVAFAGVACDAVGLTWQAADPQIVPVTFFALTLAGFLGLGNGAVFKLVPQEYPASKGAVTGIVGAAGGLGGFFPPLLMGVVKDATGEFVLGFALLVVFAVICIALALSLPRRPGPEPIEEGLTPA